MGASGWNYFTPYQADVGQALEDLREQVFREKRFGDPILQSLNPGSFPEEALSHLPPEQRAAFRELMQQQVAAMKQMQAARGPNSQAQSIDELLEMCAEEGTHSILDIAGGISDGPDFGTAFPMPDDVKRQLFGTTQPTHEQVEAKAHARSDELERWQCWYVVVYEKGQPREIYFEGCSGD